jgi:acyl-[acyl-carrier-protein]-phospholipid O-acyltransferase/long-chain-fatty-acid--[acyl-carrier-protein] ligase
VGLTEFFSSFAGVRIGFDVAALACAGGLFVVPLFTAIQADAAPDRRARIVGGVNILNAAFIVFGVLATALLQSKTVGVSEPVLLAALGVLNLGAAFYVQKSAVRGAA